jgi:16S rRNA (guanine966-N2)-methyltransferase
MRIIAGACKGRVLLTPAWDGLRPTSDRLRETLFNILAPRVQDARVLDGYAGTGAVGLEALSRGAGHVTFIERDRRAVALTRANAARCRLTGRYTVVHREALSALRSGGLGLFDVVFLDPPYDLTSVETLLAAAAPHVAADGVLVLEHASRLEPPTAAGALVLTRQVRQGDSALAFYHPAPVSGEATADAPAADTSAERPGA